MRKLATVQKIKNIRPIENADRLEKANVEAFQVVIPKGNHREDELVVFFEADSFLPVEDRYSFLTSSYKDNEIMGQGYRIKVQKLRGTVTHGLVMSLDNFPEITNPEEDLDVTELLNVKKWDISREDAIIGDPKPNAKPSFVPTTDEIRIQTKAQLIEELTGKPFYISTKIDGMSVTMYVKDGEFGITSRKVNVPHTEHNKIWKFARDNNVEEKLRELSEKLDKPIILQGEFTGPGIQSNKLGLDNHHWYVFNVFINGQLQNLEKMIDIVTDLDLELVPIEFVGDEFDMTMEELFEQASTGKYPNGHIKEGIVVRSREAEFSDTLQKGLSFKVINDEFWSQED